MGVEVIAIAPSDGWAFVVEGDRILLLRPPYRASTTVEVSPEVVENSIRRHGFKACDIQLENVSEAVTYVKNQYVQSKESEGIARPSAEQLVKLLQYADEHVLYDYLDRAERQLIPEARLDQAEYIALEIASLDKARANPDLLDRALSVAAKSLQAARLRDTQLEELSRASAEGWETRFPNAVLRYTTESLVGKTEQIAREKHLIPLAGWAR